MVELNAQGPIEVFDTKAYSFRLRLDTSGFTPYERQGLVEDIKVPKKASYMSLADAYKNPAACTEFGYLEPLDANFFGMGRSEQLHTAISGVHRFRDQEGRYPDDTPADRAKVLELAKAINDERKASQGLSVEEVDEKICGYVSAFAKCSITSMAAMFGGFVAQEIVKFTGKYSPLKQWAHYDVFESLPEGEVNRAPMGGRYDD